MKGVLGLSILTSSVLLSSVGLADGLADDRSACLAASTDGQTLRNAHHLVDAREQFRICARRVCPGVVQRDCGEWLDAVEKSLPTIVLSAKDGAGHDLFDVTVTLDGKPLVTKLGGQALPLDPGAHTFRFALSDGTTATQDVLVREGDKLHDVAVVLQASSKPAPEPPPAAPPASTAVSPAPSSAPPEKANASPEPPAEEKNSAAPGGSDRGSTQRILGAVIAGAGVVSAGVGAGLALAAKSADNNAQNETGYARYNDSGSAVGLGNTATAVFALGAGVAAAGVVIWLTAPSAKVTAGTNGREIFVGGRF